MQHERHSAAGERPPSAFEEIVRPLRRERIGAGVLRRHRLGRMLTGVWRAFGELSAPSHAIPAGGFWSTRIGARLAVPLTLGGWTVGAMVSLLAVIAGVGLVIVASVASIALVYVLV